MLPSGVILNWSGAIVDIPSGYVICDGNNGTPDLRNRFVVGAGDTYAVDDTGGSLQHTHTFTGDGHNHAMVPGLPFVEPIGTAGFMTSVAVTGTTGNGNSLQPFYALAFIMKT